MFHKIKKVAEKEFGRFVLGAVALTLFYGVVYGGLMLFGFKSRWAYWIALLCSKAAGYLVNKYYVFQSRGLSVKEAWAEAGKYFSTRGLTTILSHFLMVAMVEYNGMHPLFTEGAVKASVAVLDYFIGRYLVFKTGQRDKKKLLAK